MFILRFRRTYIVIAARGCVWGGEVAADATVSTSRSHLQTAASAVARPISLNTVKAAHICQ